MIKSKKKTAHKTPVTMTPARKRVAIAKDVIAQLRTGRFEAAQGTYVEVTKSKDKKAKIDGDVQLSDVISCHVEQCEVCAKGALFVAAVERFNALKVKADSVLGAADFTESGTGRRQEIEVHVHLNDWNSNSELVHHLGRFFSLRQLTLIEAAFEGWSDADETRGLTAAQRLGVKVFNTLYEDADERMTMIMWNIVRNKGTFVCEFQG